MYAYLVVQRAARFIDGAVLNRVMKILSICAN